MKTAAELTDTQRRMVRAVMESVGCLRCPSVVIVRGRNCNSYGCRANGGDGCARLDAVLAARFRSTTVHSPEPQP